VKIIVQIGVVVLMLFLNTGCVTTSTYGATFSPIESTSDTYSLKIYYGGPPPQFANSIDFQEGTESALYEKAMEFIAANPEFKSYKVVNIEHSHIPSYYEYKVKFLRE
jgi:hypothetical protein